MILTKIVENNAYQRLIQIGIALSAEKDIDSLLDRILNEAKSMANADAGTLYLKTNEDSLRFAIVVNDMLNITQGGLKGDPIVFPDVELLTDSGKPNLAHIASRAAITGKTLVVDDAYSSDEFDFSGTERFDELAASLCIEAGKPINDSRGEVGRLIDTFRIAAEESVPVSVLTPRYAAPE